MTSQYIGPMVNFPSDVQSGDQQVQQEKQNAIFGNIQSANSPYKFNSYTDYLLFKKAKLQRAPEPLPPQGTEILAYGSAAANMNTLGGTKLSFINDIGDGYAGIGTPSYPIGADDAMAQINCQMDFYFFGLNYGREQNGGMTWNSNNALLFGSLPDEITGVNWVDYPSNLVPAILMGNFDRRSNSFYQFPIQTVGNFKILKLLNFYQNYYLLDSPTLPTNNQINGGQYEIRLVKEQNNLQRQWIEIRIQSATQDVGYSANYDTDPELVEISHIVDPTKLCAWNITDGSNFYNPCGTKFTENQNGPKAGLSFTFASDQNGANWQFVNNSFLTV